MPRITRRSALAAGAIALPRFAVAQADQRPTLTVAVQKVSNSNTFEPPREQSNVGFRVSYSYAETLIDSNWQGDLSAVPGLATSWRRVNDMTVEFELREGVRFHNGDAMTAEDVVFSFGPERLFGTGANSPREPPADVAAVARRSFPDFERIEIVRPGVVRFVNRVPDLTLEGRIAQNVGVILSRRGFAESESWLAWARRPIGTGPYRIADFRPDVALTLEAHDGYWGGRPPVRQIRFVEVPEVPSRINGLLSGEFDFACDIPPDQIAMIERNPRYEVQGSPINNTRVLVFDRSHPSLANPLVRRAFTHAVDRQAIVEALWAGRTAVPKGLQLESYGEMFIADWDVPRYDPAEARRLLREAGYRGQPIPYRLLNNYYTGQTATAQVLVEMWRAVGLNVQIEMRENWNQVLDRATQRGIRDWSVTSIFSDPVAALVRAFGPRGEAQLGGEWSNADFNAACAEIETTLDRDRRRSAIRRAMTIAEREDPGYVVLHQTATFTAKRRDIAWRAARGWPMDFRARNLGFGA